MSCSFGYSSQVCDVTFVRYGKETVSSYNARLPRPPMTNGIPAKLAAARLRRYEEQTTKTNVTVNVEANIP